MNAHKILNYTKIILKIRNNSFSAKEQIQALQSHVTCTFVLLLL